MFKRRLLVPTDCSVSWTSVVFVKGSFLSEVCKCCEFVFDFIGKPLVAYVTGDVGNIKFFSPFFTVVGF